MDNRFYFRHGKWIAVLGGVILIGMACVVADNWRSGHPTNWQAIGTVVALILGFVYFVQKQKLDDVGLFHKLFTQFNERYDDLNATLNEIMGGADDEALTLEQRSKLN